ncbi:Hsp20 family protein [Algihabitans albus]|uniref:Hsp20 family protein n=1 Tax=Algihabitans albus TaxID=2164067 RepID=UPI0013C36B49|nr:Hsp20 family protein [Algihabitans albus]
MANRRTPPSSMPAARGNAAQSSLLLEGLTLLAKMAGQALEQGTTELSRTVQVPLSGASGSTDDNPGVINANLRVRTCSEAAGGNLESTPARGKEPGPASRLREPLVDVFDEDKEIVVAAEVPGCGIDDVDVSIDVDGRGLTLTAKGVRGYRRHLILPASIELEPIEKSCNNGMLNVRLSKRSSEPEPTP